MFISNWMHCFSRSNSYSSSPEFGIIINIHTVLYLEISGFSELQKKKKTQKTKQCYYFNKFSEGYKFCDLAEVSWSLCYLVVTSSIKLENIKESKQDKDLAFSSSKIYQQMILLFLVLLSRKVCYLISTFRLA